MSNSDPDLRAVWRDLVRMAAPERRAELAEVPVRRAKLRRPTMGRTRYPRGTLPVVEVAYHVKLHQVRAILAHEMVHVVLSPRRWRRPHGRSFRDAAATVADRLGMPAPRGDLRSWPFGER